MLVLVVRVVVKVVAVTVVVDVAVNVVVTGLALRTHIIAWNCDPAALSFLQVPEPPDPPLLYHQHHAPVGSETGPYVFDSLLPHDATTFPPDPG